MHRPELCLSLQNIIKQIAMKRYIPFLFLLISIFVQAQNLPLTGDSGVHDPFTNKHDSTRNTTENRQNITPAGKTQQATQEASTQIYDEVLAKQLGADDYGMKSYYLVILKTGKNKNKDKAAISKAFSGHMQNIKSLAAEGKLIVAGPISKNRKNYRGIFILNAGNETEAMEMLLADAAIREKYLEPEIYKWYGSAALPLYLEKSAKISKKSF
jgi:uncharacterized protein